jgi:hypothetical protein
LISSSTATQSTQRAGKEGPADEEAREVRKDTWRDDLYVGVMIRFHGIHRTEDSISISIRIRSHSNSKREVIIGKERKGLRREVR